VTAAEVELASTLQEMVAGGRVAPSALSAEPEIRVRATAARPKPTSGICRWCRNRRTVNYLEECEECEECWTPGGWIDAKNPARRSDSDRPASMLTELRDRSGMAALHPGSVVAVVTYPVDAAT
jgi:hypothetical protein